MSKRGRKPTTQARPVKVKGARPRLGQSPHARGNLKTDTRAPRQAVRQSPAK
jgi:hypothetical protein